MLPFGSIGSVRPMAGSIAEAGETGFRSSGFKETPYDFYRRLREQAPAVRIPGVGWLVTAYEPVKALLRDPRLRPAIVPATPRGAEELSGRAYAEEISTLSVLHQSGEDHVRLRRLAQPWFTPAMAAARRRGIEEITAAKIDEALERGRIDVVNDLGRPLAMVVASDLLGIPVEMRPVFERHVGDLIFVFDTERSASRERGLVALMGILPHLQQLISEWRVRPPATGNLLWSLDEARARGEVSEGEVFAQGALMLFAAQLSTQHLIGNGFLALMQHRDQWDLLRARPELIQSAVEEIVRFDTPTLIAPRMAVADIEIGDKTIGAGEPVTLLLAAANRDPAVFADPDRLDITRSPNPHLGFGFGAHYCIGGSTARLEAEVVIGALSRRVPDLRLADEPLEWGESLGLHGLTALTLLVE
jgi:cytochrome P450